MIYTEMTKKALKLCFEAHKNQTDKSGMPYVFHPFHLAEQMDTEETVTAALLHDVVEDTKYTLSDLERMGFSPKVIEALRLLTHNENTLYLEYVSKIRSNPIARAVKIADLRHNSDLNRLETVTEKDQKRMLKYRMAEAVLMKDSYDNASGCYRKRIPLDFDRLYFLSVFYVDGQPIKFSLDIEAASDAHYELSPQSANQLRALFSESASLPEALADFFKGHGESQFRELLEKNSIPYMSFHYD